MSRGLGFGCLLMVLAWVSVSSAESRDSWVKTEFQLQRGSASACPEVLEATAYEEAIHVVSLQGPELEIEGGVSEQELRDVRWVYQGCETRSQVILLNNAQTLAAEGLEWDPAASPQWMISVEPTKSLCVDGVAKRQLQINLFSEPASFDLQLLIGTDSQLNSCYYTRR